MPHVTRSTDADDVARSSCVVITAAAAVVFALRQRHIIDLFTMPSIGGRAACVVRYFCGVDVGERSIFIDTTTTPMSHSRLTQFGVKYSRYLPPTVIVVLKFNLVTFYYDCAICAAYCLALDDRAATIAATVVRNIIQVSGCCEHTLGGFVIADKL